MGRAEWKAVAELMEAKGGTIHGGFGDHKAIMVFWIALVGFSIFAVLVFSCADGAAARNNSHPDNHATACGGGCGGGCGG